MRIEIRRTGVLADFGLNGQSLPNLSPFPTRVLETYNAGGKPIDLTGPFFNLWVPTAVRLRSLVPVAFAKQRDCGGHGRAIRVDEGD